jgi:hypothetical protein
VLRNMHQNRSRRVLISTPRRRLVEPHRDLIASRANKYGAWCPDSSLQDDREMSATAKHATVKTATKVMDV